jgi:hypothetical protein
LAGIVGTNNRTKNKVGQAVPEEHIDRRATQSKNCTPAQPATLAPSDHVFHQITRAGEHAAKQTKSSGKAAFSLDDNFDQFNK